MEKIPYKWYVTDDEEYYSNGFNTKQEAIEYANSAYCDDTTAFVIEARLNPVKLSSEINMRDILENIEDHMEEYLFESDLFFDLSDTQIDSLQSCVVKAIDNWQKENNLVFMEQMFFDIKTKFEFVVGEEYV